MVLETNLLKEYIEKDPTFIKKRTKLGGLHELTLIIFYMELTHLS